MGKPFEKDDPRINRRGRPKKGETLTDLLREKIETTKTAKEKLTRKERIVEKLIALAEGGDFSALRYLFDRLDGKPKESIEMTDGAVDQRLREIMNGGH
jgi:ribosomal protein L17